MREGVMRGGVMREGFMRGCVLRGCAMEGCDLPALTSSSTGRPGGSTVDVMMIGLHSMS